MNPFSAHAALARQYQNLTGDGTNSLATLAFVAFPKLKPIGVTHTEIVTDFELMAGRSSKTMIERCEFLVADVSMVFGLKQPQKGNLVTLKVNPALPQLNLQLWHGGLQPGGEIYRFMLVDANFSA